VLLPLLSMYLMSDAPLGIGRTKNVFNAQITGFLTVMEFVFQFPINANHSIKLELVDLAMLVIT